MAYGLSARSFKEAKDFSIRVMKQFELADPELVGFVAPRLARDLLNGVLWQLEIVVKVHELWHRCPPR